MMVKLAIIILIKIFVIKYLDVLLMTAIVFHMKIAVSQLKLNVKEQHHQEYSVFGIKFQDHV